MTENPQQHSSTPHEPGATEETSLGEGSGQQGRGPSRRRVVGLAGAATVGAVALSACGSGQDEDAEASPSAPSTPTDVAAVEDVPVGSGVKVDKNGVQAVVAQPTKGTFTAYSPVCPHQGCMVNPANKRFVCPCHSSAFNMSTGDVEGGPATTGLTAYPVTVENGRVIVG